MYRISFYLILIFSLFSCKKNQPLLFAGGFVGGTYNSIAESLKKLPDWSIKVIDSNGSLDNIYLVKDGKVDMALVQMDMYRSALYADQKIPDSVKPVVPVLQDEVHLITRKQITTPNDLKGKKIVIGHAESGIKATSLTVLLELGISDTDVILIEESPTYGIPAILNGEVDAVFVVSGMPVKILTEIPEKAGEKIHLLSLNKVFESKLNRANKIYALGEIPAGTYSWQKEKVDTLLVQTVLFANKAVKEETINSFVDSILKNKLVLEVGHPEWKQFTKDNLRKLQKSTPDLFNEQALKVINQ